MESKFRAWREKILPVLLSIVICTKWEIIIINREENFALSQPSARGKCRKKASQFEDQNGKTYPLLMEGPNENQTG